MAQDLPLNVGLSPTSGLTIASGALTSTPAVIQYRSRNLPVWLRKIAAWSGFAVIVVLGWDFLIRDSLRYLEWAETAYQRFWHVRTLLASHVLTASIALLIAPLQFSGRVRQRWPKFHRGVGWTYIACAMVTAPVAFGLSLHSVCRMCVPPFAIWSVLFFVVTALALLMAVRRQFKVHRHFMIRSWVLLNGFVFVRLDNHLPYPLPAGEGISRPAMLIWIAWVVPLILTEIWLSWAPELSGARSRKRPAGD